jgi:hypothetical protein
MSAQELKAKAAAEILMFERLSKLTSISMVKMLMLQEDKIAKLKKERDEALILCDFKDKDIDACTSVLSNVYSSGCDLQELEEDVKYILVDHIYASSTNGKALESYNLEQQAKALSNAHKVIVENKMFRSARDYINFRADELLEISKALKEGKQ